VIDNLSQKTLMVLGGAQTYPSAAFPILATPQPQASSIRP
jgi:hypothetical protein